MPELPFVLGWLAAWALLASRYRLAAAGLLLLPGTAAHEFAHYAVALLTRGRPLAPRLAPRRGADERWELGEVRFEPAAGRTAPVALAPLYLVPLLAWALWQHADAFTWPWQACAGYLFGLCVWAMWPSSPDWALATRDPVGAALVLGGTALGLGWAAQAGFAWARFAAALLLPGA